VAFWRWCLHDAGGIGHLLRAPRVGNTVIIDNRSGSLPPGSIMEKEAKSIKKWTYSSIDFSTIRGTFGGTAHAHGFILPRHSL
jgi:hypothetical protein